MLHNMSHFNIVSDLLRQFWTDYCSTQRVSVIFIHPDVVNAYRNSQLRVYENSMILQNTPA